MELDIRVPLDVIQQPIQHPQPPRPTDDVRMHRQREHPAAAVQLVERIAPRRVDMLRRSHQPPPVGRREDEVRVIVQRPVDRQFDQPLRRPVRRVAAHQTRVVAKAALAQQRQRVVAQLPRRRAVTRRRLPDNPAQDLRAQIQHLRLLLRAERRGRLVQVAVMPDLVARLRDPLHDRRIALRNPARHVERGRNPALLKQRQNVRYRDRRPVIAERARRRPVLNPGIAVDHPRRAVDIKRDDDGALIRVARRPQRSAAARAVTLLARPAARPAAMRAGHPATRSP